MCKVPFSHCSMPPCLSSRRYTSENQQIVGVKTVTNFDCKQFYFPEMIMGNLEQFCFQFQELGFMSSHFIWGGWKTGLAYKLEINQVAKNWR